MRWLKPFYRFIGLPGISLPTSVKSRREAVLALRVAAARDDWHAALRAWPRNRSRINRTWEAYRRAKADTLVPGRSVQQVLAASRASQLTSMGAGSR